jgi:hypothetical protein
LLEEAPDDLSTAVACKAREARAARRAGADLPWSAPSRFLKVQDYG